MCLSGVLFKQQCVDFISKCRQFDEDWKLISYGDSKIREFDLNAIDTHDILGEDLKLLLVKNQFRKSPHTEQICTYEYNVTHSESYEVPVMYFCVSYQDGSPVELENLMPYFIDTNEIGDINQVLSQVVHPVFFRPFYMIHPCRTKDFMQVHSESNPDNYLISWISIVANLINLRLDYRFFLAH